MPKHNLLTIKTMSQAEAWRILDETLAAIRDHLDGLCDRCGEGEAVRDGLCPDCLSEVEEETEVELEEAYP